MADLNKVFLMGRLTFDPDLRRTPNGTAVSELRMATSRTYTTQAGERKEEKLFIDVTVWDRQAENCCQYLKKGSAIHVEGSLKMDTWDDKTTGEKRSKIRVQAERVQFLDRRETPGASEDDSGGATRESAPRRTGASPTDTRGSANGARGSSSASPPPRHSAPVEPEPAGDDDEDIPF
jgi:single-strand DNA-binding protein